ncbi:hypothetical protein V8C34DRAFT_277077 [Trichoderma compactum]
MLNRGSQEQIANNEAYTDQRNSAWFRELVTNGGLFGTSYPYLFAFYDTCRPSTSCNLTSRI